jgi:hypothetical protein
VHPDDSTPEYQVATRFMAHKGYRDIAPVDVDKIESIPCWYFFYALDDGATLELEVFWDDRAERWETTVSSFRLGRGATEQLVGR